MALTGPEAAKASRTATLLQNQLSNLRETIETDKSGVNSKEYVKKIVELTDEITQSVIPGWRKVITCLMKFSFN